MESFTTFDRECSALAGLFQLTISDMKSCSPMWEELLNRSVKLHTTLKGTLSAVGSFLDAFQRIADQATNSRGSSTDVGATLTRLCLRHREVLSRVRTLTTALLEGTVHPVGARLDDWKRTTLALDRDHTKEYKKARAELKKKTDMVNRLYKKAKKSNKPQTNKILAAGVEEVTAGYMALRDAERATLRRVLLEERSRYCLLATAVTPVLREEVGLVGQLSQLQEILQQLHKHTADAGTLPPATEQVLQNIKDPNTEVSWQTPPSSPSSLSGSHRSHRSSLTSITSASTNAAGSSPGALGGSGVALNVSPSHHPRSRSASQSGPFTGLVSGSSQDSGFTSQDALHRHAISALPLSRALQASRISDISNLSQPSSLSSSDGPTSLPPQSTHAPAEAATSPVDGSTVAPTATKIAPVTGAINANGNMGNNITNTSTWPNLPKHGAGAGSGAAAAGGTESDQHDVTDRPHTISSAYEKSHIRERPSLGPHTFTLPSPHIGGTSAAPCPSEVVDGASGSGDSSPLSVGGSSSGGGAGGSQPPYTATISRRSSRSSLLHFHHHSASNSQESINSQGSSASGIRSKPPLPSRCSSLERPALPEKKPSSSFRQRLPLHHLLHSHQHQSKSSSSSGDGGSAAAEGAEAPVVPDFCQAGPDMIVPQPVYSNMSELAGGAVDSPLLEGEVGGENSPHGSLSSSGYGSQPSVRNHDDLPTVEEYPSSQYCTLRRYHHSSSAAASSLLHDARATAVPAVMDPPPMVPHTPVDTIPEDTIPEDTDDISAAETHNVTNYSSVRMSSMRASTAPTTPTDTQYNSIAAAVVGAPTYNSMPHSHSAHQLQQQATFYQEQHQYQQQQQQQPIYESHQRRPERYSLPAPPPQFQQQQLIQQHQQLQEQKYQSFQQQGYQQNQHDNFQQNQQRDFQQSQQVIYEQQQRPAVEATTQATAPAELYDMAPPSFIPAAAAPMSASYEGKDDDDRMPPPPPPLCQQGLSGGSSCSGSMNNVASFVPGDGGYSGSANSMLRTGASFVPPQTVATNYQISEEVSAAAYQPGVVMLRKQVPHASKAGARTGSLRRSAGGKPPPPPIRRTASISSSSLHVAVPPATGSISSTDAATHTPPLQHANSSSSLQQQQHPSALQHAQSSASLKHHPSGIPLSAGLIHSSSSTSLPPGHVNELTHSSSSTSLPQNHSSSSMSRLHQLNSSLSSSLHNNLNASLSSMSLNNGGAAENFNSHDFSNSSSNNGSVMTLSGDNNGCNGSVMTLSGDVGVINSVGGVATAVINGVITASCNGPASSDAEATPRGSLENLPPPPDFLLEDSMHVIEHSESGNDGKNLQSIPQPSSPMLNLEKSQQLHTTNQPKPIILPPPAIKASTSSTLSPEELSKEVAKQLAPIYQCNISQSNQLSLCVSQGNNSSSQTSQNSSPSSLDQLSPLDDDHPSPPSPCPPSPCPPSMALPPLAAASDPSSPERNTSEEISSYSLFGPPQPIRDEGLDKRRISVSEAVRSLQQVGPQPPPSPSTIRKTISESGGATTQAVEETISSGKGLVNGGRELTNGGNKETASDAGKTNNFPSPHSSETVDAARASLISTLNAKINQQQQQKQKQTSKFSTSTRSTSQYDPYTQPLPMQLHQENLTQQMRHQQSTEQLQLNSPNQNTTSVNQYANNSQSQHTLQHDSSPNANTQQLLQHQQQQLEHLQQQQQQILHQQQLLQEQQLKQQQPSIPNQILTAKPESKAFMATLNTALAQRPSPPHKTPQLKSQLSNSSGNGTATNRISNTQLKTQLSMPASTKATTGTSKTALRATVSAPRQKPKRSIVMGTASRNSHSSSSAIPQPNGGSQTGSGSRVTRSGSSSSDKFRFRQLITGNKSSNSSSSVHSRESAVSSLASTRMKTSSNSSSAAHASSSGKFSGNSSGAGAGTHLREGLLEQIRRGAKLRQTKQVADRSAPRVY